MLAGLSPTVLVGAAVPLLLAGAAAMVAVVRVGVLAILRKIDNTETRVCTEVAAVATNVAHVTSQVSHQGAQIAYLQGRLGYGFQEVGERAGPLEVAAE